ncbi:type II toxin-antitoxin system RelE/ParE family toxin [Psychromarinibacter sp. S121]|uniref:type II toxin-antitoxin system RelE/ParE family toxin n=1 Tax=Psychromarinibacter sp. S121 TaxID=3415127 RepID=UPI003C7C229B
MVYDVLLAEGVDADIELIFDFLFEAACDFGESEGDAFDLAVRRITEIQKAMRELGYAPHQGSLLPHLGAGIRNVTKGRAVFYFDTDDTRQVLRILAVFFGGQDHQAGILMRLLGRL